MKKVVSIMIVLSLIIGPLSVFGNDSMVSNKVNAADNDETYYEITEFNGSQENIEFEYDGEKFILNEKDKNKKVKLKVINSLTEEKNEEIDIKDFLKDLNKTNKEERKQKFNKGDKFNINQFKSKRVYVSKDNTTQEEELLKNKDINVIKEIKSNHLNKDVGIINKIVNKGLSILQPSTASALSDNERFYSLVLSLYVSSPHRSGSSISYTTMGTANWDSFSVWKSESQRQSDDGYDFIGFAWGGGYNSTNEVVGVTMTDSTDTKPTIRTSGVSANKSYGWKFDEKVPYLSNVYEPTVDKIVGNLTLSKNNYQGENTKVIVEYIHTYKSYNYSFDLSSGGLGFNASTSSGTWDLQVPLNIQY